MKQTLEQNIPAIKRFFEIAANRPYNAGRDGVRHEGMVTIYDEIYSFTANTYSPGLAHARPVQGQFGTRVTKNDELKALIPGSWMQELHVYDENNKLVLHFEKGKWPLEPKTWNHHRIVENLSYEFKRGKQDALPALALDS